MFSPTNYQVRTHRSGVQVAYRMFDLAALLVGALVAVHLTAGVEVESLAVIGSATLTVHLLSSELTGLYRAWRGARVTTELWCVLTTWLCTAPATLGLGLLTQYNAAVSYETKLLWLCVTPMAMGSGRVVLRMVLRQLRRKGFNTRRLAICGVNPLALQLAERLQRSPELGLNLIGFFDDRPEFRTEQDAGSGRDHAGRLEDVIAMARSGKVDMILITFPMRAEDRIRALLAELADTTASVYIVPDFFVFQMLHARWNQIDGLPIVSVFETPITGIDGMVKRIFDIVVGAAALVALAVPMLVIALLVKVTSPGPVFFRQKRYGLSGEEIRVWKFRSMRCCDDGPVVRQAAKDDDRITAVGRVLRRLSLDELPQLFNVLDGSMSLVGPRPHATAHNEQYRCVIDGYMLRHKVKPGITGLAQVNGWRGETETIEKMQRRVEFDHRYIREWSLWMDVKILIKTIAIVWKQEGAY
jgi:putative colanic acid biosynthesis UDP-glucose lipid carrier transferase